jgi:hypothetical protein
MISFGIDFVAGRKRVPSPATGKTAFVIFLVIRISHIPTIFQSKTLRPHGPLLSFKATGKGDFEATKGHQGIRWPLR